MILFILSVIGLTLIITESEILKPVHEWVKPCSFLYKLMECNQCSGFWCGLLLAPLLTTDLFPWFACGCAGSFLAPLGYGVLEYLE